MNAQSATAPTLAARLSPLIGEIAMPPAAVASANTAVLKATRSGGRCWSVCTVNVAANTITVAAAHPKSTAAATPNTNDRVTPPTSTPSIGTGYLSASMSAARNPARDASRAASSGPVTTE